MYRSQVRVVLFAFGLAAVPGACSSAPDGNTEIVATEGRVHLVGEALSLSPAGSGTTSSDAARDFMASMGSHFTYVASVDSPIDPATGTAVQATNFAFDKRYAYVVYNTFGENVSGALEIVDLNDPQEPALVSSLLFANAEFADVRLIANYALLVGNRSDGLRGAAIVIVDVSDVTRPRSIKTLDLPGHVATSIAIDATTAYVTTGDNGGLVVVDVTSPSAAKVKQFSALPNAVNVLRNDHVTYVLGGSPGAIYTASDSGALLPFSDNLASGPLSAPSRMAIWNGQLYTNAGSNQFVQIALDGSSRKSLAAVSGTANGLDVGGGMAVLAQGEVGTAVYNVLRPGIAQSLGSFAFSDERGSSNEVRFGQIASSSFIFLSNGLTGFRIVGTNMPLATPTSCVTSTVTYDMQATTGGSALWCNSVFKTAGSKFPVGGHLFMTGGTISFGGTKVALPDAVVSFAPSGASASTTFDGHEWYTVLPYDSDEETFLTGLPYKLSGDLPKDSATKVSACFASDVPGFKINWQAATANYPADSIDDDFNHLHVKATHAGSADDDSSDDQAGTPEAIKTSVKSGGTGDGGSNYTGGHCNPAAVTPVSSQ